VEVGAPDHDGYLRAILAELAARAPRFETHETQGRLVSIYFGGGTPSLWRPDCVATAIAEVRARFAADGPLEITLEANPTDCDEERLAAWHAAGVNRLSIGIQSIVPDELVVLGRDHRFGDGPAALERVLASGAFRTSCDFILGTPIGRRDELNNLAGIETIARTAVDHLSVYELTIEDRTAFGQRVRAGRLVPLDEDTLTDLYTATHDRLVADGFEHYEISSYARPGRRAVHNSLYWRGAPFLGLGVGAASLAVLPDGAGERATNPRRVADYLRAPGTPAERIDIDVAEMRADRAWLGMRTSDGVLADELPLALVDWLVAEALAERRGPRICPTLRGFLMADRVAARISETVSSRRPRDQME
jgi:oxygen-independent coproporphyrinogen-3 oxidase